MMVERHYTVRFLTPAFLGNAEQSGQWRTPPFKALLRQWWRVAVAAECKYNVDELRRREAALFGTANDDGGASNKSQIRIRLSQWNRGGMETLPGRDLEVIHPEVKDPKTHLIKQIGSSLYLGFGPISGNALKNGGRAIDPDKDHATFSLAYPQEHDAAMRKGLWLMDRYGTLGGRSRNGWGSAVFTEILKAGEARYSGNLGNCAREWRQSLSEEWAHAIGCDKGTTPLVWETSPKANWRELMKTLAQIKIGLRTQFMFHKNLARGDKPIIKKGEEVGINHGVPQHRHWLSYPTTNHPVDSWKERGKGDYRLPNTLRFKARLADDGKSLIGVIFHVPCKPPSSFSPDIPAITEVWDAVHSFLDELTQSAPRHYPATISNDAVIASLNAITLKRIPA